jgi:Cft2 family RNA processing exonuclease
VIEYLGGIKIKGSNFWLDAKRRVDFSFVSHAHVDHILRHKKILATPETAKLCQHRLGEKSGLKILEYNVPQKIENLKITLFPAGHILGSSQILVEKDGQKLVYTGDFKLRKGCTTPKAEIKKCDILIMESTFGLPQYIFPSREEIEEKICKFIEKAFFSNSVPVLLAYSLGKAQEVIKMLGDKGYKLSLHGAIFKIVKIYEEFGIKFKNYQHYEKESLEGKVLVAPPFAKNLPMIFNLTRKKTAFLSGWALDNGIRNFYKVDETIPLSDHADFSELLEYAQKCQPKKIYTVHGFPEFVGYLRKEGFEAEQLKEEKFPPKETNQELLLNYDLFREI